MILIADCGSTKTDWVLIDSSQIVDRFRGVGLNIVTMKLDIIKKEVANLPFNVNNLSSIYFYGAGLADESSKMLMQSIFQNKFPKSNIYIETDVLAAARGLFNTSSGVFGILGTGSAAGYYNGFEVSRAVPSLGYILGDDGSSTDIAMRLLREYLLNHLPYDLVVLFEDRFKISKQKLVSEFYSESNKQQYLSQFSHFVSENISHIYIEHIVYESLYSFISQSVLPNMINDSVEIRLTGSISFIFKNIISNIGVDLGVNISRIEKTPIEGLVEYHLQNN